MTRTHRGAVTILAGFLLAASPAWAEETGEKQEPCPKACFEKMDECTQDCFDHVDNERCQEECLDKKDRCLEECR